MEKIVETSQFKSAKSRRKILTNKLRTAGYETFANLFEGSGCKIVNAKERYTARRMDHISHFLLLLGMSQSSSSRWWIWKMEGFLFEWRLSALLDREIKTLAANNYLKYPMASFVEYYKPFCHKHQFTQNNIFDNFSNNNENQYSKTCLKGAFIIFSITLFVSVTFEKSDDIKLIFL